MVVMGANNLMMVLQKIMVQNLKKILKGGDPGDHDDDVIMVSSPLSQGCKAFCYSPFPPVAGTWMLVHQVVAWPSIHPG